MLFLFEVVCCNNFIHFVIHLSNEPLCIRRIFFLLFSNSFSNKNFICRYFLFLFFFSSSSDGSSSNSSTQQTGKLQKSLCCIGSKTQQDKLPRVQPNLTLSKFYYFSIVFVFHHNFPPRKLGK